MILKLVLILAKNDLIDKKYLLINTNTMTLSGVLSKILSFKDKPSGVYDFESGNKANLKSGYLVSFHQNEADTDGKYKSHYGRYDAIEYENLTNKIVKNYNAVTYIGVVNGDPEVCFLINSFKKAKEIATKYNQKSVWINKTSKKWINPNYDEKTNPSKNMKRLSPFKVF